MYEWPLLNTFIKAVEYCAGWILGICSIAITLAIGVILIITRRKWR